MSEYSHCSICGGSFVGIGNVCPGCEHALSREPLEIRQVERQTRNNSEPLRDIISEARGVFKELLKHGYAVVSVDRMADIIDRIEAALSEPLRNCDVYTVGEALRKYGFPTKIKPWGEKEWLDFCEWLVSEVEGETKGE